MLLNERDDVGIVPSALFVLVPISVTGLILTTKYHSLIWTVIESTRAAVI